MPDKYLFVGGNKNGRRLLVSDAILHRGFCDTAVYEPLLPWGSREPAAEPSERIETYQAVRIKDGDGAGCTVFAINPDTVITDLIAGYGAGREASS